MSELVVPTLADLIGAAAHAQVFRPGTGWTFQPTEDRTPMVIVPAATIDAMDQLIARLRELQLDDPGHVLRYVDDEQWSVQHPAECRPDLNACELPGSFAAWARSYKLDPGDYRFVMDYPGSSLWVLRPVGLPDGEPWPGARRRR